MPQDFKKYEREELDGRVKIPKNKHELVRSVYKELKSQRKTAIYFNVSRRLIMFILYPERYEAFKSQRKEKKVWLDYYDREKYTKAIQKYRNKKRRLRIAVK